MDSASATAVVFESPDQPEVIALIAELDAYQDTLYPPESRHSLDLTSLKRANVLFALARNLAGEVIGCGAFSALHLVNSSVVAPHALRLVGFISTKFAASYNPACQNKNSQGVLK